MVGYAIVVGIIGGIFYDAAAQASIIVIDVAEASATTTVEKPKEKVVLLEVHIDWTEDRIKQEIRKVFHETPNTAVAIAECESHFRPAVQSGHILSYGREESYGIFQIHAKVWHTTALRLGYDKYQTEVIDNLKMARYIYDAAGQSWTDWTCYKTGDWRNYLK